MKTFSGIKDVDRKILEELDDKNLFSILLVNKYLNKVADENFWKRRLISKYPGAFSYKTEKQHNKQTQKRLQTTWKQYYLNTVRYVTEMKNKFDFNYTSGDPAFYYKTNLIIEKLLDGNKFSGVDRSSYTVKLLREGHEDLAYHLSNKTAKKFQFRRINLSTQEWNYRKNHLLNIFSNLDTSGDI
jgi:hypothetical protein